MTMSAALSFLLCIFKPFRFVPCHTSQFIIASSTVVCRKLKMAGKKS